MSWRMREFQFHYMVDSDVIDDDQFAEDFRAYMDQVAREYIAQWNLKNCNGLGEVGVIH